MNSEIVWDYPVSEKEELLREYCAQPCRPPGCPYCRNYWLNLIESGYMDEDYRWTAKGLHELGI